METEYLAELKDFKADFDLARASCASNKGDGSTKTPKQIILSETVEKLLVEIAKTGQTSCPWRLVKPVFLVKLDQVVRWYNSKSPFDKTPELPNCSKETFKTLYSVIMTSADSFTQAPFTIQRLCELLCYPEKHYKRIDKYLRALEKNLTVVTTVDEQGCKQSTYDSESGGSTFPHSVQITSLFEWINKSIPKELPTLDKSKDNTNIDSNDTSSSSIAATNKDSESEKPVNDVDNTHSSETSEDNLAANSLETHGSTSAVSADEKSVTLVDAPEAMEPHAEAQTDSTEEDKPEEIPVVNKKRSLEEDGEEERETEGENSNKRAKTDKSEEIKVEEFQENTPAASSSSEEVASASSSEGDEDHSQSSDTVSDLPADDISETKTSEDEISASGTKELREQSDNTTETTST